MTPRIVVPTYNERDTIGPLLAELRARLGPAARILVVDDSSPDGTGARVRDVMARDRETAVHRGRRLRDRADWQRELDEALAAGDSVRASEAREGLQRRGRLAPLTGRKPNR